MAQTARTHVSDLNTALPGADLTENHQNAFLLLHQLIKDVGGVVVASSDSVTADLTDNISVIGDVVSDTGTNPHSWVVYDMTAIGGYFLGLECHDGTAVPADLDYFGADVSGYDVSTPVVTALPTPVTAANEWSRTSTPLIPTTTPATPMTYHSNRTETGSWWFGVSIDGTGECETLIIQEVFQLPDHASYPYAFYMDSGLGAAAGSAVASLTVTSNWRGHYINGPDLTALIVTSAATAMSNLTSGLLHSTTQPVIVPWVFHSNITAATRSYGAPDDLRLAAAATPSNVVEDTDTDTYRRVTMQNLWLMVDAAELAAGPNYLSL